MASLFQALNNAHDGEAVALLGREFELTPKQTEAAVTALLPAISAGLKQSTATVDGLGNLFAVMGQQKDLHALYDDAETALGPEGLAAGNDVLSVIFGSPDVSQAVVDQAQKFSGVDSNILKKLLPVVAGILVSGLTQSGTASASPGGPAPSPGMPTPSGGGGGLGDILGQISDARCRDLLARLPARVLRFLLQAVRRPLLRRTRATSLCPAAICSVTSCGRWRKGSARAASNRWLSGLCKYPYRADKPALCHRGLPLHRCRAATSLAKFCATSLGDLQAAKPKRPRGNRDRHLR